METNRDYFSYSQYALFNSSPKAFYKRYGLNEIPPTTKYQRFGKELMESLEFVTTEYNEVFWKDVSEKIKAVIQLGKVEEKIEISVSGFDKKLLGIIDALSITDKFFVEIKTGKIPWTQSRVLKDEQVLFYALLIYRSTGNIPTASLLWAETEEDVNGDIAYTGKSEVFFREFTEKEIVDFELKVKKTMYAVEEYVHDVETLPKHIDDELLKLLSEKKRIEERIDVIKSDLLLRMNDVDVKYSETDNFSITLTKRKSWSYSSNLKKEIKESNEAFKKKKIIEENDGTATFKESKYLIIKSKK